LQDSIKTMTSKETFALGRVHEQLGNADSALFYYKRSYDSTGKADPERAKYLYSQARMLSTTSPEEADSIFMVLNDKYPNSAYGKEASTSLGFVGEITTDDAAEIYRSGMSFRRIKDYNYASRQFNTIAASHAESPFAPKSLYALGWMFERDLNQADSAIYYYGLLLERYPRSEYAREIRPSVEFALAKMNNTEIEDSLLFRDLDKELLERAKAGERGVLDQMIDNNKDALDIQTPGLNLPNIPGITPQGGGNLNDMLKNQLKGGANFTPPSADTTRSVMPDTTRRKP